MSPRLQFNLRDLLWLVLAVAAFFAGMALKGDLLRREQAALAADPRGKIPGVRRDNDGNFHVMVEHPDGTLEDQLIPPVKRGRSSR